MRVNVAAAWLLPGFTFTALDAWLSIQSMAGILQPANRLAAVMAAVLGAALTMFAVIFPVWGSLITNPAVHILRYLLFAADILTSAVGAIWYGVLGAELTEPVDFDELHYQPSNWFVTSLFIAGVLLFAYGCHMFGTSLMTLKKHSESRRRAAARAKQHQGP